MSYFAKPPIYPPPTLSEPRRVQFYLNWRGFLLGITVDDAVVAFMLGPLTIEVWR